MNHAARRIPIIDGHNDALLSLHLPKSGEERSFFEASPHGHLDLPRARAGGMAGGFFAIFVPNDPPVPDSAVVRTPDGYSWPMAAPADPRRARDLTLAIIDRLDAIEREAAGDVRVVRSAADLERCLVDGVFAIILHFEGAEAIAPDLSDIEEYHARGLRSLGLVWSRPNAFGEGVPFRFPDSPDTGPGLTAAGRDLVRACDRLGIMIDLAHLNERGFWEVADMTTRPLVATHSAAWNLCHTTRNLTDRQLDAIAESGGVVGLNFAVPFLRADGARDSATPIAELVRHMVYLVERMGIDHVALGSDFDGALIPSEIGDARGLTRLMAALEDAGFDEPARRRIAHENWLRIARGVWQ